MAKKIKLGLLGCGTVGTGVLKVLQENYHDIRAKIGNDIEVSKVLVRNLNKKRDFNGDVVFTDNIDDILNDESIDIVVEYRKKSNFYNELKNNLEKEKIQNKYFNKIQNKEIYQNLKLENLNLKLENLQSEISHKKIELHSLELDRENIEPKLENLARIEEKLVNDNEKMLTLENLNLSMNMAKQALEESYEEMKSMVTPKFTKNLSENISKITNGKYRNVRVHDQLGLIVELEDGSYVEAAKLSIGTIDQLYLSLRLSMIDELSEEKMPIFLDESFAYFDKERLENILKYLLIFVLPHIPYIQV